jgi:hypothetical protein
MTDNEFYKLPHVIGKYKIHTRRSSISKGYQPDLTLKNNNNNIVFIFENERGTLRKGFIGDLLKAYKFCDENKLSATLIIVLEEDNQRNIRNIKNHIEPYFKWLKIKDKSNNYLRRLYLISDTEYLKSNECKEIIGSHEFYTRGDIIR